jgi:hypothetical protein
MRHHIVWIPAFAVFLAVSGWYLFRLYAPYTYVWRPEVLLSEGILQPLMIVSALLIFQVVTIAASRPSSSNRPSA